MKWRQVLRGALIFLPAASALCDEAKWRAVAEALGKTGTETPDGVYRVGLPRTDLKIVVDGVEVKPALALGSWLAFRLQEERGTVMGDLVLTADEVNPVLRKLVQAGIEATALHNHLLRASPETFYMHIHGTGEPVKLAAALHEALALSHTPLVAVSAAPAPLGLDTALIDRLLGAAGKATGGVYQLSFKRAGAIREARMDVPGSMGTAEAINFQSTGAGQVAIAGDFVLTADEVTPVVNALTRHGIEVTALHNHMLREEPRLFFLHFWATGDVERLASGLRAALDRIELAKE